jgi:hypothetical protein
VPIASLGDATLGLPMNVVKPSNKSKNQPNKTDCDDGCALREFTPRIIAIEPHKSACPALLPIDPAQKAMHEEQST